LCLPLCLPAQQNKLIIAPINPITVKRGGSVTQSIKVVVLPGFHVNSDKPKDEFLIPLKLTWTEGPLESKAVSYPKPEEIQVGGQNLVVFTGSFPIETKFAASSNAAAGAATMTGKLHYQACNSQMCFRPGTIEVHVPVTVE
jgi:hypothetical protein